ncbi:MAG: hypothetical protein QM773_09935 [Hyphomonadaceae bacterium]
MPNRSPSAKSIPRDMPNFTVSNDPLAKARQQPVRDSIVELVSDWMIQDERVADLQKQWQRLESALFVKAANRGRDCGKAVRGNSAEARAMRLLDVQITHGFKSLAAGAAEVLAIKASTLEGALAKLELGLRLQGPFDWRENARELIDDGSSELKSMLANAGLLDKILV